MSKIIFNEHQRRILEANPNVKSVSDRSIQYNPEFKLLAVKENQGGKGPSQIFIENGFDLEMIGTKKAKESLSRWRRTYKLHGEEGFLRNAVEKEVLDVHQLKDYLLRKNLKKLKHELNILKLRSSC